MTARTWLTRLMGLTVCLISGCLPQVSSSSPTPSAVATTELPLPRHNSEPITRAASAIEPPPVEPLPEPVKVEMIPAPVSVSLPAVVPVPPPESEKLPALVVALRAVLDRHPTQAVKALENYDQSHRERLLTLLQLAALADDEQFSHLSPLQVAATLDHLNEICRRLRPKAPLKIGKLCLCRGIQGFGQYEMIADEYSYRSGNDGKAGDRVQVYAEVSNFASKLVSEGRHETKLATALEVHDVSGRCISKMALGTCSDYSLTPRSDYYLNFQFHIPSVLEPGAYRLWVLIQDVTADGAPREAKMSLPLRVRAAK